MTDDNFNDSIEYIDNGFRVRKTARCCGTETLKFIEALCHKLILQPDPMVVSVYDFKIIDMKSIFDYVYSYDMKRLNDISDFEKNIIDEASLSKWFSPSLKSFRKSSNIDIDLAWDKYYLLMNFLTRVIDQDRYHDLHGGNIMKDNDGSYRLIDLEGFCNSPLSRPSNSWITNYATT